MRLQDQINEASEKIYAAGGEQHFITINPLFLRDNRNEIDFYGIDIRTTFGTLKPVIDPKVDYGVFYITSEIVQ